MDIAPWVSTLYIAKPSTSTEETGEISVDWMVSEGVSVINIFAL